MKFSILKIIIYALLVGMQVYPHAQEGNKFKISSKREKVQLDGNNSYLRKIFFKDTTMVLKGPVSFNISGSGSLVGIRERKADDRSTIYIYDTLGNLMSSFNFPASAPAGFCIFNNGYFGLLGQPLNENIEFDPFQFNIYDRNGKLYYSNDQIWGPAPRINRCCDQNSIAILTSLPELNPPTLRLYIIQHLDSVPIVIHNDIQQWENSAGPASLLLFPNTKMVAVIRRMYEYSNTDTLFYKYDDCTTV